MSADRPRACYDCGLPYGKPGWCDCHIPDEIWLKISPRPSGGGKLCITCIAKRLVAAGIDDVPLKVTSGPWRVDDVPLDGAVAYRKVYDGMRS